VFGVNPDGPSIGKLLIFSVAGETEVVIVISFGQLGSAGPSMGIVTIKAENLGIEMSALLKVKPLLVVGLGMGLRISPESWLELVVVG
jgi:hypothetical protein